MSNKFDWRGPAIFGVIFFFISLPLIGSYTPQQSSMVDQSQNFQEDLKEGLSQRNQIVFGLVFQT